MCIGSQEQHQYFIYKRTGIRPNPSYNLWITGREGYDEEDEEVACADFFKDTVIKALGNHSGKNAEYGTFFLEIRYKFYLI